MKDNFEKLEDQGRFLLNQFFTIEQHQVWDLDFSKDKYCRSDLSYFSGMTCTRAELKTRAYNHQKTWTNTPEGWIIEKQKYEELLGHVHQGKAQSATYINLFLNAVVIWDLKAIQTPTWIKKLCWSDHTCTRKVLKEVAYLKTSEASHIFNHSFTLNRFS